MINNQINQFLYQNKIFMDANILSSYSSSQTGFNMVKVLP
jgi:hypothetical protein